MKYIFAWVFAMAAINLSALGLASFIKWDAGYFYIGNWNEPARLVYFAWVLVVGFVATGWCVDEHQKSN